MSSETKQVDPRRTMLLDVLASALTHAQVYFYPRKTWSNTATIQAEFDRAKAFPLNELESHVKWTYDSVNIDKIVRGLPWKPFREACLVAKGRPSRL